MKVENTASLVGSPSTSLAGSPSTSLAELREGFGDESASRASKIAPSTRNMYLTWLDAHVLRILGPSTKAADVTTAHLRTMIDRLRNAGASGSSVRGVVTATSAMFRYAVRRVIVPANPVRLLGRGDRPSTLNTRMTLTNCAGLVETNRADLRHKLDAAFAGGRS